MRLRDHEQTVYDNAHSDYNNRIRASLTEETQPRKWRSSLTNFIFGVDSTFSSIRLDNGSVGYT